MRTVAVAAVLLLGTVVLLPVGGPVPSGDDVLAYPKVFGPGDQVSFHIEESAPEDREAARELYTAGARPREPVEFWAYRNGSLAWGGKQVRLGGARALEAGEWNVSLETGGRLAVATYLPGVCGWTLSTTTLDDVTCPPMRVSGPRAFSLDTWVLDRPQVLRAEGDVTLHFYDEYLRPLGTGTERRYEDSMMGVVVVDPGDSEREFRFEVVEAPPLPADPWAVLVFVLPVALVLLAVLALLVRRRRRARDPAASDAEPPRP